MEEAAGVVVQAGDANRAADDADRGQELRGRRLAAECQLKAMAWPMITSAATLMRAVAQNASEPPAWVLEARAAGEQHPRARLYDLLNTVALASAAAVVVVLCLYQLGAARAEGALDTARVMLLALFASASVAHCVGSTDSWGGTAASLLLVAVTAAVTVLYILGELKGFVLRIGKALLGA